ncbi:MAG: zinc ribbon domain-containing protein [Bacillota bacterium]|nr:zinc ribbon domain-containing protein [Bacillota bacterium]
MFCKNCGSMLNDYDKFCTNCGLQISDSRPDGYDSGTNGNSSAEPRLNRQEFINLYVPESIKKSAKNSAILGYICSGITVLLALYTNNYFIIFDALIIVGLCLGIQLSYSFVCSVVLLSYSVVNVIYFLVTTGKPGGWLIILAGIYSFNSLLKVHKMFKEYKLTGNTDFVGDVK